MSPGARLPQGVSSRARSLGVATERCGAGCVTGLPLAPTPKGSWRDCDGAHI